MSNKVKEAMIIMAIIGIYVGFLVVWFLSVYGIIGG